MTEIAVLEDVEGPAIARLAAEFAVERAPTADCLARPRTVRALIVRNRTRVDGALLATLPRLEIVARAGAGLDNVDVEAAARAGVVVVHAPGANAEATAHHTLALALAVAHGVVRLDGVVRRGGWERALRRDLGGETWGVVGLGHVGRRVAELAAALGMRVVAHDPLLGPTAAPIPLLGLDALLRASLVVSLHVPLSPGTRRLIGARELASMPRGGVLVNTARGELVDEGALAEALRRGHLAGAGLDVRQDEPPAAGDPLASLDAVVLTPHVAGLGQAAQARVLDRIADDVRAVLRGGRARGAVGIDRPCRG